MQEYAVFIALCNIALTCVRKYYFKYSLRVLLPLPSENGLNTAFKPFFDAVLCSEHGLIFRFWRSFQASKCSPGANNSNDSVCYIIKIASIIRYWRGGLNLCKQYFVTNFKIMKTNILEFNLNRGIETIPLFCYKVFFNNLFSNFLIFVYCGADFGNFCTQNKKLIFIYHPIVLLIIFIKGLNL